MNTMKASLLFLPIKSKAPSVALPSLTQLLTDGGYIRSIGDGLYAFLPLGMLVLQSIIQLIRTELKRLGGQEILLPMVSPMPLLEATGQDQILGSELLTLKDSKDRILAIAPSHDAPMLELLKGVLHSSWQLPAYFFQIQAKAKDDLSLGSAEAGFLAPREYLMNDSFSVHQSFTQLNNFIPKIYGAFRRIFTLCGLEPLVSEGAPSDPFGLHSHDFIVLDKHGDYRVVVCEQCHYIADQRLAVGLSKISCHRPLPLERGSKTATHCLGDLLRELGFATSQLALAHVYSAQKGFVMAVARADQAISRVKLSRILGEPIFQALDASALESLDLCPGFMSPMGLDLQDTLSYGLRIVVDKSVAETPNLLIGANLSGEYWVNSNFGRDYEAHLVGDIAVVDERQRCYHCGGELKVYEAIKIASIDRVNDMHSRALSLLVKDDKGTLIPPCMGFYGLSITRLLGAVALSYRDERGLRWPLQVTPYKAVLQVVGKNFRLQLLAQEIHDSLGEHLLWDDRPISFSQKCLDADRMGISMRIIISTASLADRSVMILSRTGTLRKRVTFHTVRSVLMEYWRLEREAHGLHEEV